MSREEQVVKLRFYTHRRGTREVTWYTMVALAGFVLFLLAIVYGEPLPVRVMAGLMMAIAGWELCRAIFRYGFALGAIAQMAHPFPVEDAGEKK